MNNSSLALKMQNQEDSLDKLLDGKILETSIAKLNKDAQNKDVQIDSEMNKLIEQINSEFSKITEEFKQKIARYEQYLPNFPESLTPPKKPKYNKNFANMEVYGNFYWIELVLAVDAHTKGIFFKKKSADATLMIKTKIDMQCINYKIPPDGELLSETEMSSLTDMINSVVISENYDLEFETRLIRAISAITGISYLPQEYFTRQYQWLQTSINNKIQEMLKNTLESVNAFLKESKLPDYLRQTISSENLKQKIYDYLHATESAMSKEFSDFKTKLVESEKKQQEMHAQKEAELDAKIRALDLKLQGHRKKLFSDENKILPELEKIFPDKNTYAHYNYECKVDHDLRVFYTQKLKEDLKNCEHVSVEDALCILNTIRNSCFLKNENPTGTVLRESYAGLRAICDYLDTNDASASDVLHQIETTAQSRKAKFKVEELIETALSHDFEMDKYRKGLHDKNAKTNKDLGVK